ncbi:MAG: small multi-drug export protein [Clostridiales Family XIII bacterium]|jgi:uncharacterized membrane protein|nr:small multi-drug export protein [Clostridiales Family XIII bacterium]
MERIFDLFEALPPEIAAFVISMLPITEVRGGLIFSAVMNLPFLQAFLICLAGNILPVPLILFFLRKILRLMDRNKHTAKLVHWLEGKARKAEKKIHTYELFGLFVLVAIPLPGTGAWTGSLVAVIFDIQIKRAFPTIALGVLTAALIMSLISYFIPGLFF